MKIFVVIIALFLASSMHAQELRSFRKLMQEAEGKTEAAKQFLKKSENEYKLTKKPIFYAYSGVAYFFLAKNSYNPVNKFSFFTKGKKILNDAILKAPEDVEIRYLRYLSQKNAPSFLGYNEYLSEDKKFLKEHYQNITDKDLYNEIKKNLN